MSTEKFYDDISEEYHLIASNWDAAVRDQGRVLGKLIGGEARTVLDCSCGIGTQAIGLALQGYEVTASDLSSKAVARARAEADRLGATVGFAVSDFRELEKRVSGTFDAVISCDNSLPHLLTAPDMELSLRNVFSKLRPTGTLLMSIRDYDQILTDPPTGMPPRKYADHLGTRIYLQTWDWSKDNTYELELFLLKLQEESWKVQSYKTRYRAWKRSELDSILGEVGFENLSWLTPEDSGYYQPVLRATRS